MTLLVQLARGNGDKNLINNIESVEMILSHTKTEV